MSIRERPPRAHRRWKTKLMRSCIALESQFQISRTSERFHYPTPSQAVLSDRASYATITVILPADSWSPGGT